VERSPIGSDFQDFLDDLWTEAEQEGNDAVREVAFASARARSDSNRACSGNRHRPVRDQPDRGGPKQPNASDHCTANARPSIRDLVGTPGQRTPHDWREDGPGTRFETRYLMSTRDTISADVRAWYDGYANTFTSLARGESSDLEAWLEFFAIPSTVILDNRYLAFTDGSTLRSFWGALIDQLRRANYPRSDIHRLDVRPLNPRAALIEGMFTRHDGTGKEFARFDAVYLAAKTDGGWRFTAVVLTQP
jgi:hypothetical protein